MIDPSILQGLKGALRPDLSNLFSHMQQDAANGPVGWQTANATPLSQLKEVTPWKGFKNSYA